MMRIAPPHTEQVWMSMPEPGDIVTWRLGGGQTHVGLVTAQRAGPRPLVAHNIGAGVKVEDRLFSYRIAGHFRYR